MTLPELPSRRVPELVRLDNWAAVPPLATLNDATPVELFCARTPTLPVPFAVPQTPLAILEGSVVCPMTPLAVVDWPVKALTLVVVVTTPTTLSTVKAVLPVDTFNLDVGVVPMPTLPLWLMYRAGVAVLLGVTANNPVLLTLSV